MAAPKKPAAPTAAPRVAPPRAAALLDDPSMQVWYGQSGSGKSTAAALAFGSDFLFVIDDAQVLRPLASLLRDRAAELAEKHHLTDLPEYRLVPGTRPLKPGEAPPKADTRAPTETRWTVPVDNLRSIMAILKRAYEGRQPGGGFLWKCADGETRHLRGIVFDEWSGFMSRVDVQLREEFGDNGFEVNRRLHALHRFMRDVSTTGRISIVFVCHAQEPTYHVASGDEKAAKVPTDLLGTLKYPGGPKLPTAPLAAALCSAVSFVFRFFVSDESRMGGEGGPSRRVQTALSQLYYAKGRDFGLAPEINLDDTDLRTVLAQAGCVPDRAP